MNPSSRTVLLLFAALAAAALTGCSAPQTSHGVAPIAAASASGPAEQYQDPEVFPAVDQWLKDGVGPAFESAALALRYALPCRASTGCPELGGTSVPAAPDPDSLEGLRVRLAAMRVKYPALVSGELRKLDIPVVEGAVLAFLRTWRDTTVLCVFNHGSGALDTRVPVPDDRVVFARDLLGDSGYAVSGGTLVLGDLEPWGFRILSLER